MTFSQAIERPNPAPKSPAHPGATSTSPSPPAVDVSDGTKFVLVSSRRILDNWVASADDMLAEDWEEVSK